MSSNEIRTFTHSSSGAAIKIHPYGATVLSYSSGKNGKEHLFVSESAVLDGTKPVRGGIPVVFPIFGPPSDSASTMPQHGFARRNFWTFLSDYDKSESAGCSYELNFKDVVEGKGGKNKWADAVSAVYDCTLQLSVDFTASRMTTTLKVENTGKSAFPFEALLHTYYQVQGHAALDPEQCYVTGLQGYTVTDKVVSAESGKIASTDPITIASEVDRVYSPPSNIDVVCVTIGVGNKETIHMNATGQVDGTSVPVSCVVWNPHKEKAEGMSDFGKDEYNDMICVEPGILGNETMLEPGKEATLEQVVTVPSV